MPRAALGLAVLVVFGVVPPVVAQNAPPPPVVGQPLPSSSLPAPVPSKILPPEPITGSTPVQNLPPILGAPVAPYDSSSPGLVRPASGDGQNYPDTAMPSPFQSNPAPRRAAVLAIQTNNGGQYTPPSPEPVASPPPADANDLLRKRASERNDASSGPRSERSSDKCSDDFSDKLHQLLGNRNEWFKSDHAFDGFISPVTNPFLFEDPRSLTEVRPIFLIEKIPNSEPDFHGGNTFFFGTQLRLAITDRLSFTINKFGFESFNPGSGSPYPSETGFAEFWFGPKYTFIRNENSGTLMAGGLQFQVPTGAHGNFQDTGSLSMVPYVSFAQSFLRELPAGSFNVMASTGYSFSVNNERSDYFYLSGHLDMNLLNANHFFPFVEMNWFVYTTNGTTTPIGVEGQDLINFGGQARGQGYLSFALGGRYKFSENYQLGAAFEFPIAGPHDIDSYRFTLDFIFRY